MLPPPSPVIFQKRKVLEKNKKMARAQTEKKRRIPAYVPPKPMEREISKGEKAVITELHLNKMTHAENFTGSYRKSKASQKKSAKHRVTAPTPSVANVNEATLIKRRSRTSILTDKILNEYGEKLKATGPTYTNLQTESNENSNSKELSTTRWPSASGDWKVKKKSLLDEIFAIITSNQIKDIKATVVDEEGKSEEEFVKRCSSYYSNSELAEDVVAS